MAKTAAKHAKKAPKLDAAVVCPAVRSMAEGVLAQAFPRLAVVGVTLTEDSARAQVDIALERVENSQQTTKLAPTAIADLPRISLEDCEAVSRALADPIESLPALVNKRYILEVGSPGVFRRLTTPEECQFYVNWPVAVKQGQTMLEGWIASVSDNDVTVEIADGRTETFLLKELAKKIELTLNPTLAMPNDE